MNLKLILQILLVMAIISTVCICITKPTMHKSVLVYDSGYTITPQNVETVEETEIPIMIQPPEQETVQMTANQKIDNQISEQQNRILQYIDSETTPVTTTQVQKIVSQPREVQTQQKTVSTTKQQQASKVQTSTKTNTQTTEHTSKPTQTTSPVHREVNAPVGNNTVNNTDKYSTQHSKTIGAPEPVKVLTPQEEEIAWNRWRSNLQNKIMKDSKLPNVPNGTIFKFSFTVDKYGKVTNVKTWSETNTYTPYAIQYIAPVIRSYQGRAILNFPQGSNRFTTNVTGGWKISANAKYSTPQDFNDIEKIRR